VIPAPGSASLAEWLRWQETQHPTAIDLGLERVQRVLARTGWRRISAPVITVGGTNGKGSCVALLDSILRSAGYSTGTFTSPHLVDYRERIRLSGRQVSDASLLAAFERIAAAQDSDSLTFFEFNTLAALLVFETRAPDAVILEVGLGGRLDAVNVVDADVAIVSSIGLDHMEWLGPDIESIAREKAGIFRAGRPAVCGCRELPGSSLDSAGAIGARLLCIGQDFDAREVDDDRWDFEAGAFRLERLPRPALTGGRQLDNAACVIMALRQLQEILPLDREAMERGLQAVSLPGRFQRIAGRNDVEWVLDVAHNPAAAAELADSLRRHAVRGRTVAVCGMLGDKDVAGVLSAVAPVCDVVLAAATAGPRGLSDHDLVRRAGLGGVEAEPAGSLAAALERAEALAGPGERVLVFGSFHTVGPALEWLAGRGLILRDQWMNS
jgi:dihydrofolate synthase/folylpolyglutamate synthase